MRKFGYDCLVVDKATKKVGRVKTFEGNTYYIQFSDTKDRFSNDECEWIHETDLEAYVQDSTSEREEE